MDPLQVLPTDVFRVVLIFLEDVDVLKAQLVCKRWKEVGDDERTWKTFWSSFVTKHLVSSKLIVTLLAEHQSLKKAYWTAKKRLFIWDDKPLPVELLECLKISEDKKTIEKLKSNSSRYITVRGNRVFKRGTGIYQWKICISANFAENLEMNTYLKIGLCSPEHDLSTSIGYSSCGVGYGLGYRWSFDGGLSVYGKRFKNQDIVECILDTNKPSISYIHNGKHLGEAYQKLPWGNDQLYPAVSFDEPGERISLEFDEFTVAMAVDSDTTLWLQ